MSVPASESVMSSLLSDSESVCDGIWGGSEESLEELDSERLLWCGLPVLPDRLGDLEGGHSGVQGTAEPTKGDGEGGWVWVCSPVLPCQPSA